MKTKNFWMKRVRSNNLPKSMTLCQASMISHTRMATLSSSVVSKWKNNWTKSFSKNSQSRKLSLRSMTLKLQPMRIKISQFTIWIAKSTCAINSAMMFLILSVKCLTVLISSLQSSLLKITAHCSKLVIALKSNFCCKSMLIWKLSVSDRLNSNRPMNEKKKTNSIELSIKKSISKCYSNKWISSGLKKSFRKENALI